MAPIQKLRSRPPLKQNHIFPASNDEQYTSTTTTSSSSSLILPRNAPPTTHDPTIKPPWKKHKTHAKPPARGWALLWPRPPSWRCPPDASTLSGYAGCEYVEAPAVFDPEIEGLPDWMGPGGKEVRLWSGIERVVVVPGAVDRGGEVARRRVERGEEDEKWKVRGSGKAVVQLPHPLGRHLMSTSASVAATNSEASPTSILAPTPTSTLELLPTPTPTGDTHRVKGYKVGNALTGIVVPVIIILAFITALAFYFGRKLSKDRERKEKAREQARQRDRARETDEETDASESRYQLSEMAFEAPRVQRNVPEENWEDLSLR